MNQLVAVLLQRLQAQVGNALGGEIALDYRGHIVGRDDIQRLVADLEVLHGHVHHAEDVLQHLRVVDDGGQVEGKHGAEIFVIG